MPDVLLRQHFAKIRFELVYLWRCRHQQNLQCCAGPSTLVVVDDFPQVQQEKFQLHRSLMDLVQDDCAALLDGAAHPVQQRTECGEGQQLCGGRMYLVFFGEKANHLPHFLPSFLCHSPISKPLQQQLMEPQLRCSRAGSLSKLAGGTRVDLPAPVSAFTMASTAPPAAIS